MFDGIWNGEYNTKVPMAKPCQNHRFHVCRVGNATYDSNDLSTMGAP